MKKILIASSTLALALLSTHAHAGQGFIRGELGGSDLEARSSGFRDSDSGTVATFGGGYWFNPNIAIEGHVGSLYNEDLGDDHEFDLVTMGVGVAAKKNFGPDGAGFFIGGRAGIARMTAQVREDTWDVVDDEHSTDPYYGVGVGYDFSGRWGLSLNYDRRKGDFSGIDVDVDSLTVGGEFRF